MRAAALRMTSSAWPGKNSARNDRVPAKACATASGACPARTRCRTSADSQTASG